MEPQLGSFVAELLAVIATICLGIVLYFRWKFMYWAKRNLPHPQPSFPFGNMQNPLSLKISLGFFLKANYDKMKALGHKHAGLYNFTTPIYMPIDPEYVKNVMQRDFQHFADRGIYYNEEVDPLSANLIALGGSKWRHIRTKLTPTFTAGKMKMMLDSVVQCSFPLEMFVEDSVENRKPIDVKDVAARFTTDIIGTCIFGLECNSFDSVNAEFRRYGKKIFQQNKGDMFKRIILLAKPELGKRLGLSLLPRETTDFFLGVIRDAVRYREDNDVVRNDMLQLLMDLRRNDHESPETDGKALTIEEVAAQAFGFFMAGSETASTAITFCLFELASNPEIQMKVRDEIIHVMEKHYDNLTYECLTDMKYMDLVIEETLRKHPPVAFITRKCILDYKVPDTSAIIDKGTTVLIPVLALHRDPEFYPDPQRFHPERFSGESDKQLHPFAYIPFGEGPRICIGLRFGMMQIKVGLISLLKNYRFSVSSKTELPLKMDPSNVIYSTKETIWLDATKSE